MGEGDAFFQAGGAGAVLEEGGGGAVGRRARGDGRREESGMGGQVFGGEKAERERGEVLLELGFVDGSGEQGAGTDTGEKFFVRLPVERGVLFFRARGA